MDRTTKGTLSVFANFRRWSGAQSLCLHVSMLTTNTVCQVLQTIAGGEGNRGLAYIYGGRVVSGFGIGAISAVAPTYVSECSPKQVRGRITGIFQIMVAMGGMVSYFVNCNLFFFPRASCFLMCHSWNQSSHSG